jgi:hypothetical protein
MPSATWPIFLVVGHLARASRLSRFCARALDGARTDHMGAMEPHLGHRNPTGASSAATIARQTPASMRDFSSHSSQVRSREAGVYCRGLTVTGDRELAGFGSTAAGVEPNGFRLVRATTLGEFVHSAQSITLRRACATSASGHEREVAAFMRGVR